MQDSGSTIHMNVDEFVGWLTSARRGESVVYAIGDVANDRAGYLKRGQTPFALSKLADTALRYGSGPSPAVHLFQRRVGDGRFEYIAVRRGKPAVSRRSPAALAAV